MKIKHVIIGAIVGGIAGYAWYYFYGCENGCTITGSPVNSTLYFAFMGTLVPGMFRKKPVKND
ncbi:MAG: hypothetical protein KDC13_01580 [Bacteroidetes bacterium]|nr:hypothetical protein [Bacteroidota bacterium]